MLKKNLELTMTHGPYCKIDIVFCVDVTGSMQPVIESVKSFILKFPDDLINKHLQKGKKVDQIRVRVVAFGDCKTDTNAINASPFYAKLPAEQNSEFNFFVNALRANGSGEPKSALEALSIAMCSDWVLDGDRQRHIIVLFTDGSAHPLEDRVGEVPAAFASQIPSSIDELTDAWEGGGQGAGGFATTIGQRARRLVLLAPEIYPWPTIGDSWPNTVFLPSQAADGLAESEYDAILEVLSNAV
jgi:hypothetical protein